MYIIYRENTYMYKRKFWVQTENGFIEGFYSQSHFSKQKVVLIQMTAERHMNHFTGNDLLSSFRRNWQGLEQTLYI